MSREIEGKREDEREDCKLNPKTKNLSSMATRQTQ